MSPRSSLIAICLLAAALRLGAFIALDRFEHPSLWESETIATNVLSGQGFVFETLGAPYRSYMEPLYPALCAFVYRLTDHSFVALALVQLALGTALVALVYACARRVVPEAGALMAAALTAVHPGLVEYSTKFHPFVLDTALWFFAFAVVLAFAPRHPWRSACAAGLAIGLCVLTRPTILACVPMFGWWMWRRSSERGVRAAAPVLALLGCTAVVAAPWMWRNYEIHHRFMLTRSGTAFVFWLGNNPYLFTGSAMTRDGSPVIESRAGPGAGPPVCDGRARAAGLFPARSHRVHQRSSPGVSEAMGGEVRLLLVVLAANRGAIPAGMAARLQAVLHDRGGARRDRPRGALAGTRERDNRVVVDPVDPRLLPGDFGAAKRVYVEGRHRLAIEPFLLIFAAGGIHHCVRTVRRGIRSGDRRSVVATR